MHAQCHDLVCSGDRRHPRGAKGHSCSCGGRDWAYSELQDLKAAAPHAPTEQQSFCTQTCRDRYPFDRDSWCDVCNTNAAPVSSPPTEPPRESDGLMFWIAHQPFCAVMGQDARHGWREGDEQVCNCGLSEWLSELRPAAVSPPTPRLVDLSLLRQIKELEARWREEAQILDESTQGQWVEPAVKRECADDLAALFAPEPKP